MDFRTGVRLSSPPPITKDPTNGWAFCYFMKNEESRTRESLSVNKTVRRTVFSEERRDGYCATRGRRASSMQGEAAADGRSPRLHQTSIG